MEQVRQVVAEAIRARVGGPSGGDHARELFDSDGPRWFGPERPVRRVHADAAIFVGALRALLLQSLHPLAMAGVADHSDFRDDPWGRLQRTARFLATTTYGTVAQAEQACATVRRVHDRVHGVAADGRPYDANDPHLLTWVHVAEVDSFLAAHQRFGARPLIGTERDAYVEDVATVAVALGVPDPPRSLAALKECLAAYRPELAGTRAARDAARFLLLQPPVPLAARGPYALLGATAVSLLPWWAKAMLRIPPLPVTETVVIRPAGRALVATMRWALDPGSPTRDDTALAEETRAEQGTLAG
ncbi:MAG TPA: oxygenase MpaB family protein [Acidimicrobiales bacterium]|nr:oxygenase MpaB family protein [Acidimicrobiales bacterium]